MLIGSYITTAQAVIDDSGFGDGLLGASSVIQAYACDDCNSLEARTIALREAPRNSCNIYRNGKNATYCESISKTVLIPSNKSREVFKFIVTSSINSSNHPQTTIITFPLSAKENALMDEYFYLHDKVQSAVSQVNRELSEQVSIPIRRYSPSEFNEYQRANGNNECDNHPANYLSSLTFRRNTKNNLAQHITGKLSGDAIDATYSNKLSGGGFSISRDGFGANVSYQYIENNNIAFVTTDKNNRLAFDVHVGRDPSNPDGIGIGLTLNSIFTKIDGFQFADLFNNSNSDISDASISICLRDYLEEEGQEPDNSLESSGGSGSNTDPFWGPLVDGLDVLSNFCEYRRKATVCRTDKTGIPTCGSTVVTFTARCGSVRQPKK